MTPEQLARRLIAHVGERMATLDVSNRKALDLREYHMNCGRLQELERFSEAIHKILKANKEEEEDDEKI